MFLSVLNYRKELTGDSMKDYVVLKKGEYQNVAEKESAFIGVITSLNGVNVSEVHIKQGKALLISPSIEKNITEWAYLLEGSIKEEDHEFLLNQGDSILVKNLKDTIYCRALEDSRLIFLSHENVVEEMTSAIVNLSNMIETLDKKDHYTKDHSGRVVDWMPKMAKKLNLSIDRVQILLDAALFHDIGKLEIADAILHKPAKLNASEFERIKKHPNFGRIIAESHNLNVIGKVILQHHERIDGHGYPNGLKGDQVCLEAKIIAVVDSYDAMTSDRPYRDGLSKQLAVEELLRCRGTHYEEEVVDAFLEVLKAEEELS